MKSVSLVIALYVERTFMLNGSFYRLIFSSVPFYILMRKPTMPQSFPCRRVVGTQVQSSLLLDDLQSDGWRRPEHVIFMARTWWKFETPLNYIDSAKERREPGWSLNWLSERTSQMRNNNASCQLNTRLPSFNSSSSYSKRFSFQKISSWSSQKISSWIS